MNNEDVLIGLGFQHYPDWDFESTGTKNFRLEKNGKVWRAYVQKYNPPTYVVLGCVINANGTVDRWRDCVSHSSVERKINNR